MHKGNETNDFEICRLALRKSEVMQAQLNHNVGIYHEG